MMLFKGLKRKEKAQKKEEKLRPASVGNFSQDKKYAPKRSQTEESSDSWTIKEKDSFEVKTDINQKQRYLSPPQQENGYRNHPQPNSLFPNSLFPNSLNQTYKPQRSRSRDFVLDKYKEVSEKLGHIESNLQADKDDIIKSFIKLDPKNNTDKAIIQSEGNSIKEMLHQFIVRTEENRKFELQDKIAEREKLKKETDTSDAHLVHLNEALKSTKKEFQYPEYEERMKSSFNKLKTEFMEQLKNDPKPRENLEVDYNRVILFIVDWKTKCRRCNSVQTSIDIIQNKIKNHDPIWAENLDSKIAITLSSVDHDYRAHDYLNINYISDDVVEELHKLYSGYKNKIKFKSEQNGKCQMFDIGGYNALLNLTAQKVPTASTVKRGISFKIKSQKKPK